MGIVEKMLYEGHKKKYDELSLELYTKIFHQTKEDKEIIYIELSHFLGPLTILGCGLVLAFAAFIFELHNNNVHRVY